jgi:hypothetical protein
MKKFKMKLKLTIQTLLLNARFLCQTQLTDKPNNPNFYAGIGLGLDDGGIVLNADSFFPPGASLQSQVCKRTTGSYRAKR